MRHWRKKTVISLLASLPETFSMLVITFEAMDKFPSWENVVEKLLHENGKLNEMKDVSSANDEVSLFTKKSDKLPKCYECGKLGHIIGQ